MPRPETPLDVEVLLHDHVPNIDLENYMNFTEDKDHLIIEIKKFMPEGWNEIMDLVTSWDGEYDKPKRRWLIPKVTAQKTPPQPTSSSLQKTTDVRPGAEVPRFTFLPTEHILSMPFQSRQSYEDPELTDLAGSMQTLGILEPLLVRRKPSGDHELVAGHRRLAAAKQAGLRQVPCIIREMTDQQALEAHFIENLQRKDLTDYEKARMLDHLLKKFPEEYPTQRALAARIGKHESWLSQHLQMLELEKLYPGKVPQTITEHQAREILAAPEEQRPEIAEKIATKLKEEGQLPTVRELKSWRELEEPTEPTNAGPWPESSEPGTAAEPESLGPEREVPETKHTLQEIDVGEFVCPECNEKYLLVHVAPGDHRLKRVRRSHQD